MSSKKVCRKVTHNALCRMWNTDAYRVPIVSYMWRTYDLGATWAHVRTAIKAAIENSATVAEVRQALLGDDYTRKLRGDTADSSGLPATARVNPWREDRCTRDRAVRMMQILPPIMPPGLVWCGSEDTDVPPALFAPRCYLDYWCFDGLLTQQIGVIIGAEVILGVDPGGYPGVPTTTAAIADNSVDLITMISVLHRCDDPVRHIDDVVRMLRPGGILLIREHDYDGSSELLAYLHLVHALVVPPRPELPATGHRSEAEWTALLTARGLTWQKTRPYEDSNPQRLYYALYTKTPLASGSLGA